MGKFYEDMSYERYCELDGARSTDIKRWFSKKEPMSPSTNKSLLLGNAVHTALLEPELLESEYIIYPATRRGKKWEDFQATHEPSGKKILSASEFEKAMKVARAGMHNQDIKKILEAKLYTELSLQFELEGLPLKARLDCVSEVDGRLIISDVKTTWKSLDDLFAFTEQAKALDYYFSASLYCLGYEQVMGRQVDAFAFLVVETGKNNGTAVSTIPRRDLRVLSMDTNAKVKAYAQREQGNS